MSFERPFLDRAQFTSDLEQLVGFRTVTKIADQEEYLRAFNAAFDFIESQVNEKAVTNRGWHLGVPFLLASNVDTRSPDILYLVHVDVVPGKEEQFTMQVDGDIAYGRGVSDMKFSIPVGYALLNDLMESGSDTSFMLAITSDEEQGGFKGAGYLAQAEEEGGYGLTPKIVIVPDGGDGFTLITKSKGVCQIKVTAKGTPAHSSRPWQGRNALESIIKVADALVDMYHDNNSNEGWHTTMNLGLLQGGEAVNQVPAQAFLHADFRFPYEQTSVEGLTDFMQDLVNQIDPSLQVEVTATGEATNVSESDPIFVLFRQLLEESLGRAVPTEGAYGSTDARHFNQAPFIMTKPEGGDIHGDNEHINIESVMTLYRVFLNFLQQYQSVR